MNSKWYQGHNTYIQFPKFLVHDGIYSSQESPIGFCFFFKNRVLPYVLFGTWSSYLCCPNVSLCLTLSIYSESVCVCVCVGSSTEVRGQLSVLSYHCLGYGDQTGFCACPKHLYLLYLSLSCQSYLFFLKQGLALYPRLLFKISFAFLLLQYWWLK